MGLDLKRVPKWGWVAAGLVAVGVYLYMRHRNASSPAGSTTASPTDTAALGGTPDPGMSGGGASGSSGASDYSDLLSQLEAQQAAFNAEFLANQNGMDSAGITPTDWQTLTQQLMAQLGSRATTTAASSIGVAATGPGLAQTTALYQSPTGSLFTVGASGATQPAYDYPGATGGYVSPITYAGAGVTPQPITPAMSQPPLAQPTLKLPAGVQMGQHQTTVQPAAEKYYTLKKQVPLTHGDTLHFTSGKGYYAA